MKVVEFVVDDDGTLTEIQLPNVLQIPKGVTSIGSNCFRKIQNVKSVIVPEALNVQLASHFSSFQVPSIPPRSNANAPATLTRAATAKAKTFFIYLTPLGKTHKIYLDYNTYEYFFKFVYLKIFINNYMIFAI